MSTRDEKKPYVPDVEPEVVAQVRQSVHGLRRIRPETLSWEHICLGLSDEMHRKAEMNQEKHQVKELLRKFGFWVAAVLLVAAAVACYFVIVRKLAKVDWLDTPTADQPEPLPVAPKMEAAE